ncbi:hypothetical protein DPMN_009166 [Dreissena polymorpha]|uniref:Uncharacterized protein n=1 Tax=Dreissena polymorpha TaxID=45954 RepID=A0A9D4MZS3_DREPO|nr:hypothetical protein DPMN_009166 [Dreissena polymorpha]
MWMDGQRTKTNPKTSPKQSAIFQLAKNVTSIVFDHKENCPSHVIQLTGTISQLSEKNALPTGGHVFSPIWTIFKLVQHINKTNVLINSHDDWEKLKTAPPTGNHVFQWTGTTFELDQHIIKTDIYTNDIFQTRSRYHWDKIYVLTKFHEDRTINVASRVFTNKCGRTKTTKAHLSNQCDGKTDGQKTAPSPWQPFLTKFHENWAKNVTSRVKTAPPTGGHVFQRTGTTFELNQHIIETDILTNFELDQDFIGTKLLTKFHEDRTINVASIVFTNKCYRMDRRTYDGQRPVTKAHLSNQVS